MLSARGPGAFSRASRPAAMGVLTSWTQVSTYSRYSAASRRAAETASFMALLVSDSTAHNRVPSQNSGSSSSSDKRYLGSSWSSISRAL